MYDVIVVGDSNVDLMIKVEHIANHDEKVRGKLLGKYAGGIAGNFCCVATKFGLKCGIITAVGNDEYGSICLNSFAEYGVNTEGLVVNNKPTYFCVVLLDNTGEKALTIVETANLVPSIADVDINYLNQSKFVHLTSLDLSLARYVALGVKKGVEVSIDIEVTADGAGLKDWKDVLGNTSIVFINKLSIKALFGDEEFDKNAKRLLEMGSKIIVLTCGAEGVKVFTRDDQFTAPAFKVKVKDTTGAGDCFNAFFLGGIINGWELKKAALYANAAAAIAIQQVGSRTAIPDLTEVRSFLKD